MDLSHALWLLITFCGFSIFGKLVVLEKPVAGPPMSGLFELNGLC